MSLERRPRLSGGVLFDIRTAWSGAPLGGRLSLGVDPLPCGRNVTISVDYPDR